MAPPRSDPEDAVDLSVRNRVASNEEEWFSTQQVVRYDPERRTNRLSKSASKKKKKNAQTRTDSLRPRAEIVIPLHWNNTATFPEWDQQQRSSRITTQSRCTLYRSQDRLLLNDDEDEVENNYPAAPTTYRQEIVGDITMTALQRNGFQDAGFVSSGTLRGIHHHSGSHTTSIALGVQRHRRDTVSLTMQTSASNYRATIFFVYPKFVRLASHGDIHLSKHYYQGSRMILRPDVQISTRQNLELGVSFLSGTNWGVRCGIIAKTEWTPTVRLHWKHPFIGQITWKHGHNIQFESSWKATSGRHGAQCVVSADHVKHWKCILAYTMGDVTLRVPIVIAMAVSSNWQQYALRWLVATAVSNLVHWTLTDLFWMRESTTPKSLLSPNTAPSSLHTALMQQSFMKRQAMIRYRNEQQEEGLLIENATYRLAKESLDVTTVLRFWVADSKLEIYGERRMMLGFYDLSLGNPAIESGRRSLSKPWEVLKRTVLRIFWSDEPNLSSGAQGPEMDIHYKYRGQRYFLTVNEDEHVNLPNSRATPIMDEDDSSMVGRG